MSAAIIAYALRILIILIVPARITCTSVLSTTQPTKGNTDRSLTDALEAYKNRNYQKAQELFDRVSRQMSSKPNRITAYKYLAFVAAIQQDTDEAKRLFLRAFALDENFTLDKGETGNPVWMPSFLEAAKESVLLRASGEWLYEQGRGMYLKHNYDEALIQLETAVEKEGIMPRTRAGAYKLMAFIYAIQERPEDAREAFRNAFRADPAFDLDKAEYGNPVWTPLFDEIKLEFIK